VSVFFLKDHLALSNYEILNKINQIINEKKIDIVLLEGDHANIVNIDFIRDISNKVKKGIFLGDDMVWHIVNLISAQQCDFVFSSEPISVFKFKELGIEAFYVPIEGDGKIFKDRKLKKIYDVLHFGRNKTTRNEFINHLNDNEVRVKCVSPYDEEANSMEKLANLINISKIIINFAESANGERNFNQLRFFKKFYQTKGRIQMAGLSNVLCVSEYCASSELLYDKSELPFFKTKDECLKIIKSYLSNEDELKKATEKFHLRTLNYEDSNYINQIKEFIDKVDIKTKENFKAPFWYNYLFINQNLRTRFKNNYLSSFLKEFFNIILSLKRYDLIESIKILFSTVFVFLRYFPFLLLKKIINFKNE